MDTITNEEVTNSFNVMDHRDMIHEVEFDHYGKRLATCSSDSFVCVWDREENGTWVKTAGWKVHGGPIWRVVWAHPQFGQVLATCSNDRSVFIWEESYEENGVCRWSKKAYLADSRTSVTDIKFACPQLGLILAASSAQGVLRVYEAADVTDLSQWQLIHEISPFYTRISSISWSYNLALRPLLVMATDDGKSPPDARIAFYELNENVRKWQSILSLKLTISRPVNNVAFSPAVAAVGHQVAIAAGDIVMYNVNVKKKYEVGGESPDPTQYQAHKVAVLADLSKVWRLSWNVTGNSLTASSEDGTLRVWKSIFYDEWRLVSSTSPLQSDEKKKESKGAMLSVPNPLPSQLPNMAYY